MGGGGEESQILVGVPEIGPVPCFPNNPVLACVSGEGHLRRSQITHRTQRSAGSGQYFFGIQEGQANICKEDTSHLQG